MIKLSDKGERRRARRSSVLLTAAIEDDGASRPVRLINVSAEGSAVESRDLTDKGESVEFRRNDVAVRSRIVWSEDGRSGLQFEQAVDVTRLLRKLPAPRIQIGSGCWRPAIRDSRLTAAEKGSFAWWADCLGIDPGAVDIESPPLPRRASHRSSKVGRT